MDSASHLPATANENDAPVAHDSLVVPRLPTEQVSPGVVSSAQSRELLPIAERRAVFILAALLFVVLSAFTMIAYRTESQFYDDILRQARDSGTCQENIMTFQVALAPFRSLSMVRTAALFLSFVLVILGSLFVLTGIEAAYKMSVNIGERRAVLETASPGLVLVTAGALLVAASLYRSGTPEFRPTACTAIESNPPTVHKQPTILEQLNPQRN
jgi:hypothetical protein